jgi:hypothetical protein
MLLGLNNNNKQTNAKITTKPLKNLHGKDNVVVILFYQI